MYTVEKNVPLPTGKGGVSKLAFYRSLSEGDSFVVPRETHRSDISSARSALKPKGLKIVSRRIDQSSFRLWVVKEQA